MRASHAAKCANGRSPAFLSRKRKDGRTEWIPPPHLDTGQARVNNYHHPERYLIPDENEDDGDDEDRDDEDRDSDERGDDDDTEAGVTDD